MARYRVGDKVRIINRRGCGWNTEGLMDKWMGKEMTIKEDNWNGIFFKTQEDTDENNGNGWLWSADDFESHRKIALDLVNDERDRQDAKWGVQDHPPQYWVGILGEEYGEYCEAVNETIFDNGPAERIKGGTDNMIRELSHVAAVAVQAIECLLREDTDDDKGIPATGSDTQD
jgi:hypothetical protein